MDHSVKYFSSAMSGAPSVVRDAGTLISLLDACLVNGFGVKTVDSLTVTDGVAVANISTGHSAIKHAVVEISGATGSLSAINGQHKVIATTTNTVTFDAAGIANGTVAGTLTLKVAPAGWEKVFAGTNKAVYRSPNVNGTRMFYRVDNSNARYARIVGYESMTDLDTGEGRFPSADYLADGNAICYSVDSATAKKWWIAADSRTVYMGFAHHQEMPNEHLISFFGDIAPTRSDDAFAAVIAVSTDAGAVDNVALPEFSVGFWNSGSATWARTLCRAYSQLGGSVRFCPIFRAWPGAEIPSGRDGLMFPNGPTNGLVFDEFSVYEYSTKAYRGRYRGVLANTQNVRNGIGNDASITGISGYEGKTFLWKALGHLTAENRGGFALDVTGPWA